MTQRYHRSRTALQVALTCGAIWIGFKSHNALTASPKLVVDADVIVIDPNTKEGVIRLLNSGSANLQVLKIGTSCQCAKARVEKNSLAPGHETQLIATLTGVSEAVVAVVTNDPYQQPKLITIRLAQSE